MSSTLTRNGGISEAIASNLRSEIIAGSLQPGAVLRQEVLAKRFKTSRMPIRESLKILEREGLVIQPANCSAYVAELDMKSFTEINEMRVIAEQLALKHAIPELNNRQIRIAEEIQEKAENAGIEHFAGLNKDFHAELLRPCGRPRLLAHIITLNELSERYFNTAARRLCYEECSHKEHRALLEACKKRDVELGCKILEAHITNASEQLLNILSGGVE